MDSRVQQMQQWQQDGLWRQRRVVSAAQAPYLEIDGQVYLGFADNDYLGLATHPQLRQAVVEVLQHEGTGASASALVTGHSAWHDKAERDLARFVGLPQALLFSSGYLCNLGVITAWVGRGDAVFLDRLSHASLIDGARLSGAQLRVYAHADMAALESALKKSTAARKLIVSDSIFSMDGDLAPLRQLYRLCEQYDAYLLLDDAHGFGVLGARGQGAVGRWAKGAERLLYVGTLGKAAGLSGAFVAAQEQVIAYLLQKTRTYMFSTAMPASWAAGVSASLALIAEQGWRRRRLAEHIQAIQLAGLQGRLPGLVRSRSPIQAVVTGGNQWARQVSARLRQQGFWVPAICPPSVPKGRARLRISLSALHTTEQVSALIDVLEQALQQEFGDECN